MHFQIILVFVLWGPCFSRVLQSDTNNHLETLNSTLQSDISSLDDAMSAVNELTTAQKMVWEQQKKFEEEVRLRNQENEEREKSRSKALEEEHLLLKEIRGRLSRKIKFFEKAGAQNGHNGSPKAVDVPKDCAAIYLEGDEASGVFTIKPAWNEDRNPFSVYCDMDTDGGGWTVVYRTSDYKFPKKYFERSWTDYKNGFGDLDTTFWLGNERVYQLTKQGAYELRFDIKIGDVKKSYIYQSFWIEEEASMYKVHVDGLQNTTEDGILLPEEGAKFSTLDRNGFPSSSNTVLDIFGDYVNEKTPSGSECADEYDLGWWWFNRNCKSKNVNLNLKTEMKIRPNKFLLKKQDTTV